MNNLLKRTVTLLAVTTDDVASYNLFKAVDNSEIVRRARRAERVRQHHSPEFLT